MSPLATSAVALRRLLARRPWLYWVVVVIVAAWVSAVVLGRIDAIDAERAAWGDTVVVFVADRAHEPGEPLSVDSRVVPSALAPAGRLRRVDGLVARQHVGVGEIVTEVDVVASHAPQAMIPDGWRGVPIVETPPSGAAVGDRVDVVSDGVAVSGDAVVVGHHDDVTIVAVPAPVAPALPAAADARSLTLVIVP